MCAWTVNVELLKGDKKKFVGEMCVRTDVHENHTNTERNRKKQLRQAYAYLAGRVWTCFVVEYYYCT